MRFLPLLLILVAGALYSESTALLPSTGKPFLSSRLHEQAPRLSLKVLEMALSARDCAASSLGQKLSPVLMIIDYSLPSVEPRLWVFDIGRGKLLYEELVAHGKNSGGNATEYFSNKPGSLMSSLGVFLTSGSYVGRNGYSLRLRGLEEGVNHRSMERAIVMHGAGYVSDSSIRALGRLGRSWGCPAVRRSVARSLIDTVKGGALLFSYYPDRDWLRSSRFLRGCTGPPS